jgi:hypothetical protein
VIGIFSKNIIQEKVGAKGVYWLKYGVISIIHVFDISFCIFYVYYLFFSKLYKKRFNLNIFIYKILLIYNYFTRYTHKSNNSYNRINVNNTKYINHFLPLEENIINLLLIFLFIRFFRVLSMYFYYDLRELYHPLQYGINFIIFISKL